ncbi:PAS domain S-box-containing protein [Reichenbachiella faecimaris]|uniref:histidine kinase n=1 Tax=Reichenbachiella faecimaris TaxID=692418 RepID=A0A1W2G7Y5_REIFA|nr:ATP-binding protein [Reichenbachiella faecimaris]SMD32795.1 PAS domain S-box-containing protein [Reichenbachiella faecimaris]
MEQIEGLNEGTVERLLKSILDSAFNGIMTLKAIRGQDKKIINFEWQFVNDVAEEILGFDSDDLLEHKLLDILPHNKSDGLFESYKTVVETGQLMTFEQHYAGNNTDKWYKIAIVKMGDGVTVTFQDVSDLKEAILEVEAREKKYQKLFDESIDAIFQADARFRFLDANNSLQHLFRYSLDQLMDLTLRDLILDSIAYRDFKKTLTDQKRVEEYEVEMHDAAGYKKICIVNCVLLIDPESKEKSYIGVIRDMTKRRQADKELVQAEKLSMTGKIARTIAHEVRNPLTNLTLALDQLRDEVTDEIEDANLYFSIIKRNSDRIGQLITDLLNSSKPKDLKLVRQPLNDVVNQSIGLVRDRLNLQNMEFHENLGQDLPEIALDADQMNIALLNLFINAIEAMKPDQGQLKVSTALEGDRVVVHVSDNGKGLNKEDLSKLFEPFFTGKTEGTGLGLTTVQNIIRSHKGNIRAESEVGKGTTFTISFPL